MITCKFTKGSLDSMMIGKLTSLLQNSTLLDTVSQILILCEKFYKVCEKPCCNNFSPLTSPCCMVVNHITGHMDKARLQTVTISRGPLDH